MKLLCDISLLINEASVEDFFLLPLFKHLGYDHKQIKTKQTLSELGVKKTPRGKKSNYRPDFLIKASNKVQFIVEAKSPNEDLDKWTWQLLGLAKILTHAD